MRFVDLKLFVSAFFLCCTEFNVKSAMIECAQSFQQIHITREKNSLSYENTMALMANNIRFLK